MKKIITLCAVMFTVFLSAYGQEHQYNYQYHPWKKFKSASTRSTLDTAQFLSANFTGGDLLQQHFDGKPLETIFQILDKELPVKQVSYILPNDQVPVLELIFDNRKQYKLLDQFHFKVDGFDQKDILTLFRSIIGEPETVIPLTKKIRQQLGQIKLQRRQWKVLFMSYSLPDPSTFPPEELEKFKDPFLDSIFKSRE